ncbi:MAG: AtpZ/AtpI family protein [Candidatus Pacebacteria bacterium]|nr:AtpZ/AtpI family protein [Candidatus Paceibacterota bacterium]
MNSKEGLLPRRGGVEWKEGVQIFTQVSVWIVVPILLALFVGKALDAHFGTKPIIFLVLAGVGFLFSCFGIVRVISKYMKEIKDLSEKKNN